MASATWLGMTPKAFDRKAPAASATALFSVAEAAGLDPAGALFDLDGEPTAATTPPLTSAERAELVAARDRPARSTPGPWPRPNTGRRSTDALPRMEAVRPCGRPASPPVTRGPCVSTPENPPADRSAPKMWASLIVAGVDLNPAVMVYQSAEAPGALVCPLCGALVGDAEEAHTAHTMYHRAVAAIFARTLEVECAQADARLAPAASPGRPAEMPSWGPQIDRMVDEALDSLAAGSVRLILDGPRDAVGPVAEALARIMPMEQLTPIMRDATPPLRETRVFAVEADTARCAANRFVSALAVTPRETQPARIPEGARVRSDDAASIACHARAMALHLSALRGVAVDAGLHLEGETELGRFVYEVGAWVDGLETWAQGTAHRSQARRDLWANSERWCHRPGGRLPLPSPRLSSRVTAAGDVRVRLEGTEADVADALEMLTAAGVMIDDVSETYANRRHPEGKGRRYGRLDVGAWRAFESSLAEGERM